jgi:hypothetical protein
MEALGIDCNSDSSSDSDDGVDEDDVAFHKQELSDIIGVVNSCNEPEDDDEALFEEQLELMMESSDDSSDQDDEAPTSSQRPSSVSPSGVKWIETKPAIGREHRANIFTGRQGFMTGLRPATEREAFLVTFGELVDTATLYTNKSGRRWAITKGKHELWKSVDKDEILAFIGEPFQQFCLQHNAPLHSHTNVFFFLCRNSLNRGSIESRPSKFRRIVEGAGRNSPGSSHHELQAL